jgi:uncharacterized membrane protein
MLDAKANERSATLLLVKLTAAVLLLPTLGACLDGALVYLVKAQLAAAVEASALAAARSLSLAQPVGAQQANARRMGAQCFTVHFPAGLMGAQVVGGPDIGPHIFIAESALHKPVVTVTVSVIVPAYCMRILGFRHSAVSASRQATGRAVSQFIS